MSDLVRNSQDRFSRDTACIVKWNTEGERMFEFAVANKLVIRHMSRVMRKLTFCICENKDADQLSGNREADQPFCFRYIASTIPHILNPKFKAS